MKIRKNLVFLAFEFRDSFLETIDGLLNVYVYMMGCSCIVVQLTSRPLLLFFIFLSFESNLLVSAAPSLRQIDFLFSNKVGTCRKYADAHL